MLAIFYFAFFFFFGMSGFLWKRTSLSPLPRLSVLLSSPVFGIFSLFLSVSPPIFLLFSFLFVFLLDIVSYHTILAHINVHKVERHSETAAVSEGSGDLC